MAKGKPRPRIPGKVAKAKMDLDMQWRDFFPAQAYHMTRVGATVDELAESFGVALERLQFWLQLRPELKEALEKGRLARDERVESSLFSRAIGYDVQTERVFCNQRGEVTRVPITEKVPPDPGSCMFWLKNRQRGLWSDTSRYEFTGANGGPIRIEELVTQANEIGKRIRGMVFDNESGEVEVDAVKQIES